jgi:hypothetical protein
MSNDRCLIILSTKSAGSSACRKFLIGPGTSASTFTRHNEHETLYWTKAASVLELPQLDLLDSEVPIASEVAKRELIEFLEKNGCSVDTSDADWIFAGWRSLCHQHGVFLEKSPHHLYQWSALKLMYQCACHSPDIEFRFLGLIRNPMDTLYSTWKRWGEPPSRSQFQWLTAYRNLLRFQDLVGDRMHVVRYEDMVSDPKVLQNEIEFVGGTGAEVLHRRSVSKWRGRFGFALDEQVIDFACRWYPRATMENTRSPYWPLMERVGRLGAKSRLLANRIFFVKRYLFSRDTYTILRRFFLQ